jgi:S-adenosylmethionine uptake transporter
MQSLWMLLASFLFAVSGVTIKFAASAGYSTAELVFYRSSIGFCVVCVLMAARGLTPRTPFMVAHLQRGVAGTFAIWLFMYSVIHLPLSTAITLNFTAPLWIGLVLALVYGERLSKIMVAALVMGFVGIAILLKPIFTPDMRFDITIALLSGIAAAIALLNVRRLGAMHEPEMRIFFWFTLVVSVGAALWLTITGGWRLHSDGLKWLLAMGAATTAGQLAQTRAYSRGATMLAANLSYSAVLFSALAGLLIWDERIPPSGWLAIAIIISGGIMATLRTRKGSQSTVATVKPDAPATTIEPEPPRSDP